MAELPMEMVDDHPPAFEFISNLPPEVVLKITTYLPVRDALRCLAVCRSWKEILEVGEMTPFWRRACEYAGLPSYYVRGEMPNSKYPSELFHEARKHKQHVGTITPEIKKIGGGHPFESTVKCEYAGDGYFVKTIDFCCLKYEETVIGELCTEKRVVKKIDSMIGSYGQVVWASTSAGSVIWTTQEGNWFRYDLGTATFGKFLDVKITRGMGDVFGLCRNCFFLVKAGTENTMHGYSWHLNFFKIEEGKTRPIEKELTVSIPPGITQFIPRPVIAHFLQDENGSCDSHRFCIQGGTGACVFILKHKDPEGITLSSKAIETLNPFIDVDAAVMVVNTTSELTLSRDEEVLGMVTSIVYPFASGLRLHVFDAKTYERIYSNQIHWKESFNDCEVLCVSRLYTALGIGHSKGVVKIVSSRTGNILLEQSGLSRGLPPVIPMARLLFIHYQGIFSDESIVDVRSPFTLVLLYRKGIGNIEAVFFDPFPKPTNTLPTIEVEEESEDDRSG